MTTNEDFKKAFETFLAENEKFTEKQVKASARRARIALLLIAKMCKERRAEIAAAIKEMEEAK